MYAQERKGIKKFSPFTRNISYVPGCQHHSLGDTKRYNNVDEWLQDVAMCYHVGSVCLSSSYGEGDTLPIDKILVVKINDRPFLNFGHFWLFLHQDCSPRGEISSLAPEFKFSTWVEIGNKWHRFACNTTVLRRDGKYRVGKKFRDTLVHNSLFLWIQHVNDEICTTLLNCLWLHPRLRIAPRGEI